MPRFSRRLTHYKKNKKRNTMKYRKGGQGTSERIGQGTNEGISEGTSERMGVLDMISKNVGEAASKVVNNAENIGLQSLGLQKIQDIQDVSNASSNVFKNHLNQASENVLTNVNEVLGSSVVSEKVKEAGRETAEITGKLAETFNRAMDDPVVKAEVTEAIERAGEIGTVVAKASEEPVKEMTRVGVEAGTKALGAASAGVIKVGTDILGAIPGIGSIIDIGKMMNDGSKAASAVIEAGTDVVETASDAYMDTSKKVKEGLQELEEKKKLSQQIMNRTSRTINQFENPLKGGRTKRRRLYRKRL